MKTTNATARKKRHDKILKFAKGYRGAKSRILKRAKEQVLHSGIYAYRDRRNRKRVFRSLWIARINAATRQSGMTYSQFIYGLSKASVELDRKQLAFMAYADEPAFGQLVEVARAALA